MLKSKQRLDLGHLFSLSDPILVAKLIEPIAEDMKIVDLTVKAVKLNIQKDTEGREVISYVLEDHVTKVLMLVSKTMSMKEYQKLLVWVLRLYQFKDISAISILKGDITTDLDSLDSGKWNTFKIIIITIYYLGVDPDPIPPSKEVLFANRWFHFEQELEGETEEDRSFRWMSEVQKRIFPVSLMPVKSLGRNNWGNMLFDQFSQNIVSLEVGPLLPHLRL